MGVVDGRLREGTKKFAKKAIARILEDMYPEEPCYSGVEGLLELLRFGSIAVTTAKLDRQIGKKRSFELHSDISEDAVATQLCGTGLDRVPQCLQVQSE
jgi:hypothetical protein